MVKLPTNTSLEDVVGFGCSLLIVAIPIAAAVLMFLLLVVVYVSVLISPLLVDRYAEYITVFQNHSLLSISLFSLLAFGLFQLRTHYLVAFALIEIVGGLTLAWSTLHIEYASGVLFWTAFMGATYLLVRGIDNGWKGLKELRAVRPDIEAGWSTISFQEAVRHGIATILKQDIEAYYRYTELSTFRETREYEVVTSNVYIDTPIVYEVLFRVNRETRLRTSATDEKYRNLSEESVVLFSDVEHFPKPHTNTVLGEARK